VGGVETGVVRVDPGKDSKILQGVGVGGRRKAFGKRPSRKTRLPGGPEKRKRFKEKGLKVKKG